MLSFHSGLVALVVALACASSPNVVVEQEKQAVTVVVICEDTAAKEMIRESLLTHFRPLQDLEVVDKNGFSSLIVYAEKTVNDPKNPNGYAIAIAHTNSYELRLAMPSLHVAVKITTNRFKIDGGVAGREVSWQVMGTRNDPGFALRGYQTIKPKTGAESGKYWLPEAYGWTPEQGIGYQSLASAEIQRSESDVESHDQPEH